MACAGATFLHVTVQTRYIFLWVPGHNTGHIFGNVFSFDMFWPIKPGSAGSVDNNTWPKNATH